MAQIILPEGAAPATPASGNSVIYPKADGLWYSKDDAGTESIMSGAALAGSTTQAFSVAEATVSTDAARASQTRIKNDIINGQFRIAQAGTSFVSPAYASYDLDGWLSTVSSPAVVTIEQAAGETVGKFSRKVTVTTVNTSPAGTDVAEDQTRLEGYNIVKYVGQTFTISFRAKVPVAGIHCCALRNSGPDRSYIAEINFPTANVWQDCSFTVLGGLPTAGTWNYTGSIGLNFKFSHLCGATYQGVVGWNTGNYGATANQVNDCTTVGNVWEIADVRIALGTFCPPDDASYDEDLLTCRRYYRTGTFYVPATTAQNLGIIDMRATPTITGGGAGFNSTGTTQDNLIAFQTTGASTALTLASRL